MKKRNGFTLIELIATIAIMAIVSLVATVTYSKIRKDVLEHQYLNLKTLIETAAVKYSSKNGFTNFFVKDLIDAGILEPDDETDVYDPRNDKSLNCHIVTISVEKNGMLSAEMSDKSYESDGVCNTSSLDIYEANLRMNAKIEGTSVTYPVNSLNTGTNSPYIFEGWTRFNLDITADPSSIPESIQNGKYVWNRNNDVTTIEPNRQITTNEYGVYNNYYYLDLYTEAGTRYQAKMLYKFDNEKPTILRDNNNRDRIKFVDTADNNRWAKAKNVFIYATDKNGSGISKIYIGRETCEYALENGLTKPAVQPGIIQVYEVKVETGDYSNQPAEYNKFNVCVIDKAGNIARSVTEIKYIDITQPRCDHVSPYLGALDEPIIMANWIRPDRTIRAYCEDDHYITENGVERHLYGSGCVDPYRDKTYSPTTINGSTVIEDNVGWETTCSYRVLVDKTPPICDESEGESTVWQYEDRTIKQHYHDEHSGPLEDTINTKTFVPTTKVGDHVVTDNVGNTETCHPNVYVDKTPPYISYARFGDGATFYKSNCPGSISYTWTDDESGFKEGKMWTYYGGNLMADGLDTDDSPVARLWTNPGLSSRCAIGYYTIDLQGTDNVGNTSSIKSYHYSIIADPPPPSPPVNEGCDSTRFEAFRKKSRSECTYYMEVSYDTSRCPAYGCNSNEDLGDVSYYAYGSSSDNAINTAYNQVQNSANAYAVSMGKAMYGAGDSGNLYIYYTCSVENDSGLSCTSNADGWPISYTLSKSSCSTQYMDSGSHKGEYKATCSIKRKRCTQYKNGQQYMSVSPTEYTYYCCKTLNSDDHCKTS